MDGLDLQRADKLVKEAQEKLAEASKLLDAAGGDGITPLHTVVVKARTELDGYFSVK